MSTRLSRIAVDSGPAIWLAPLLLSSAIFLASSQSHLNSGLGVWDTILRKCVHAGVFGLLALLWARLLVHRGMRVPQAIVLAWIVTGLYAASDEWHQSFVPGRSATLHDVGIDIAGATIALWAWRRRRMTKELG